MDPWYAKGTKRLWVELVPSGSLSDYEDLKRDLEVVLFNWSGRFFSTWTVAWGVGLVELSLLLILSG